MHSHASHRHAPSFRAERGLERLHVKQHHAERTRCCSSHPRVHTPHQTAEHAHKCTHVTHVTPPARTAQPTSHSLFALVLSHRRVNARGQRRRWWMKELALEMRQSVASLLGVQLTVLGRSLDDVRERPEQTRELRPRNHQHRRVADRRDGGLSFVCRQERQLSKKVTALEAP